MKKLRHWLTKLFRGKHPIIQAIIGLVLITLIAAGVFFYIYILYGLPNPGKLRNYQTTPLATHILDRNGKPLYEIFEQEKRTPVNIKELPDYVYKASIAIEDKDFYHHGGISLIGGIGRAIMENLRNEQLQGGSTITQQLVKTALLTPERTIRRKLREIILALWTERLYSKDQILEMYLNQIPYGGSAYGIEEASHAYFNKSASKLTLDEAALLAGLPQAPSLYSPYANPDLAKQRRNQVLTQMKEQKYITDAQYKQATSKPIRTYAPRNTIKAPHFVFYIRSQLEKQYGSKLVEEGGLRVTTTLDLDIQEQAETIARDEIADLKALRVGNAAALVTRPPTGEILAMVGSTDYFASDSGTFNVTTALRQPGSSIKPINYAIGIDRKLVTPATIFLDTATCFPAPEKPYCPKNYDNKFHGLVPLRMALANSYNIPAVKMMAINTVESFVASAPAFMINTFTQPERYGLSLALGGGEVRMTEMAQAFSAFANHGIPRTLNGVLKVEDHNGNVLYQFKDENFVQNIHKPLGDPKFIAIPGKRAISPEAAFIISHILLDNFARSAAFGTNSQLVVKDRTVSVKTGTTDDLKDNWTVGFTPNFLGIVWVGNNDNSPMNQALTSGITGAAPIWNGIMTSVLEDQPDLKPRKPANVVGTQVCWGTGNLASSGNCQSRFEYIIKGTEKLLNHTVTTKREQVWVTKDSDKLATEGTPNTELKEKTIVNDGYSRVCVDCAGDQPQPTPNP